MATMYVRSTDGNNADNGSTWALAKLDLNGAAAADNAGDIIYVSNVHSESSAASIFFTWGGLTTLPVYVICAKDNAEPPVSATNSAKIHVTGQNSEIQCQGSVYAYGLNFQLNGTATCSMWLHNNFNNAQLWENCNFELTSDTSNYMFINAVNTTSGDIVWRNCNLKFGAALSAILPNNDRWRWEGGAMEAGSVTPNPGLIGLSGTRYSDVLISGVDFSVMDPSFYFLSSMGAGKVVIRNCKLPASWTGDFYSGAYGFSFRGEMYNCDSGANNHRVYIKEHMGAIIDETTVIKQNGATDGVTPYSLRFSANGNCNPAYSRLRSSEINLWCDLTSASVTLSVDILHDSVTPLTNRDVALEVQYLGAATSPLGSITTSFPANPIATAASNLASSSATWVTTGLTNPNRQKVSVTVVPQQRGFLQARIVQCKDSYGFYADPKLQVG